MKPRYILQGSVLAAFLFFTAACGGNNTGTEEQGSGADQAGNTEAVDPQLVAQGQEIFTATGFCYTCHGQDAKGVANMCPDLTDDVWLDVATPVSVAAIEDIVRTGVAQPKDPTAHPVPMPAMGGAQLTDDQIHAVAVYVYSLHGTA